MGLVAAVVERDGSLRIEQFPADGADVQVTAEALDHSGLVLRKSIWSQTGFRPHVLGDDPIFDFPAELCRYLDGESQSDERTRATLAARPFSILVLQLWRSAERHHPETSASVLAEMARRLDSLAAHIRDGRLGGGDAVLLERWFERAFFRSEPRWMVVLLSRLGARTTFGKARPDLRRAELSGKVTALSDVLADVSRRLADRAQAQFGTIQRFEVPWPPG
jgi:hypothetical protein